MMAPGGKRMRSRTYSEGRGGSGSGHKSGGDCPASQSPRGSDHGLPAPRQRASTVDTIVNAVEHMQNAMRTMQVRMERTDEAVRIVAKGLDDMVPMLGNIVRRINVMEFQRSAQPMAPFAQPEVQSQLSDAHSPSSPRASTAFPAGAMGRNFTEALALARMGPQPLPSAPPPNQPQPGRYFSQLVSGMDQPPAPAAAAAAPATPAGKQPIARAQKSFTSAPFSDAPPPPPKNAARVERASPSASCPQPLRRSTSGAIPLNDTSSKSLGCNTDITVSNTFSHVSAMDRPKQSFAPQSGAFPNRSLNRICSDAGRKRAEQPNSLIPDASQPPPLHRAFQSTALGALRTVVARKLQASTSGSVRKVNEPPRTTADKRPSDAQKPVVDPASLPYCPPSRKGRTCTGKKSYPTLNQPMAKKAFSKPHKSMSNNSTALRANLPTGINQDRPSKIGKQPRRSVNFREKCAQVFTENSPNVIPENREEKISESHGPIIKKVRSQAAEGVKAPLPAEGPQRGNKGAGGEKSASSPRVGLKKSTGSVSTGNEASSPEKEMLKAVKEGRLEEVKNLLSTGVDAKAAILGKYSALHRAAAKANPDMVQLLIQYGADVNVRDSYGRTALHMACYSDQSGRCVAHLIAAKCDLELKDRSGRTALHSAAKCGNMAATSALVEAGASKTAKDDKGRTPFDVAKADMMRCFLPQEVPKVK